MTPRTRLALVAATALAVGAGPAHAQTNTQTNQDRLGAVVGALFGDRLGISALDQAWLRGGRPLRDGQSQFNTRVDSSLRVGQISSAAATRLRADYTALVDLETRYAADGRFTNEERADLNSRYNALTQTLESGAAGYGDVNSVAQGRAAFEARVDASVNARRITRTEATRLKTDYQALIQLETRYAAKGSITASERNDLDSRLDALDARVGDGPAVQPPVATQTPRVRLATLETAVTAAERSGALTRADAADVRVQLGDLTRLEAAYGRYNPSADETAYLTRRLGELETRVRR
ncbi:hypothetical protein QOZ96_002703 [Brevundimonas nasdae]|uniref:hypothetical protein n=1 Tax=Brevundimonas nasdae TaxID=172043 RepID=UPI001912C7AB|nr:hypothetical protein [Brevundimonas nasdae]MBK6026098.1 hypothetical protein [Brevundimonas nasdae]MDQ0452747.1 hypothetical protein [Brevundimonas nasdae]